LNDQPDGLPVLLGRFENGDAIYRFVREHLHCGALVALSLSRGRPGTGEDATSNSQWSCRHGRPLRCL
jgi:hypothetical protein